MTQLSDKNFGLLIAYVLPGFVALWGISNFSTVVDSWIAASQQGTPTLAGFLYVTVASVAAGMTVSAIRWALIDSVHHATGIRPPLWDFSKIDRCPEGFMILVENHYRYYQFYANMLIATLLAYRAYTLAIGTNLWGTGWSFLWFVLLEVVFFAASRDTLRKYYHRAGSLLGV